MRPLRALTVALALLASSGAARAVAPPVELPAPTGPYAVGTTSWRLTDESRPETLGEGTGFRQVEVFAWYPAAPGREERAPYLRAGLAEVRDLAKRLGSPGAFDGLAKVRTHARLDAQPAAARGKLPVLLFSHGYIAIPSSYTALLEDLASHGYAVLSVIHPYEASAATLADGRVVSFLQPSGELSKPVLGVLGEWAEEDETMAAVTRTPDDAEQLRLLRRYITGLDRTDEALRRWVDDLKLVLDRLPSLPSATPAGRLAARLDLGRLGVFGHSMGGVTAGQFCSEDARCKAGLNLDGIPQYGTMISICLPRRRASSEGSVRSMWSTEHAGQEGCRLESSLMAGAQNADQDLLVMGATSRSVAGARLAIDHGRTNRLLRRPIGRFDLGALQKDEQLVLVAPQVLGQALVGGIGQVLRQQPSHASP